MTEPGPITLAYLAAHPVDAARVMETLDPSDLAAFIATVPVRLAAPSLALVAPWRAGRCLAGLTADRAVALIEHMPAERRALTLRAVADASREAILERMPERRARALRRQLGYPATLVGAFMAGDMVTVAPGASVAEARDAVLAVAGSDIFQVYVVDAEGRPLGLIPLAALLAANPEHGVRELARSELATIAAETPLSQIATDRDWDEYPERPVVDTRQRLVGTVTLGRLLAARDRPAGAVTRGPGPGAVLGRGYLASVNGLVRVAGAMLRGHRGPGHDH